MKLRRIRRKKRPYAVLTLTSLVDILTILLIFLLKSFSPEGALLYAAQDLELPESTAREGVNDGDLVLALTEHGVTLGERMVAGPEDLAQGTALLVPRLASALEEAGGDNAAERRVLIEGDRLVPFQMLYRVLFTCHQAGYETLALAAYEKTLAGEGGTP